jgi:putative ABC transport system substrate-binding protein
MGGKILSLPRRAVLSSIAGATCWPFVARAQQVPRQTIGYLSSRAEAAESAAIATMHEALRQQGFIVGQNVTFAYRWSDGDYSRLPQLAAELVSEKVSVIAAGGLPAALAAQAAGSSIPIVFSLAVDPVAFGLVRSINRPGGNITGVMTLFDPLTPKKLQLLHELVPRADIIGLLLNPKNQNAASHLDHAERAAKALGLQLKILPASRSEEIYPAFAAAANSGVGAVLVGDDPGFAVFKTELINAAAQSRIPTMHYVRDFVVAGGLISYGPSFDEIAKDMGIYLGRILNGADPADLPVLQPTKIELVINATTAKALGIVIPPTFIATADRVIE